MNTSSSISISFLDAPLYPQEVQSATFQLGKGKSPGPNGLTIEFFQKSNSVFMACQSVFENVFLLKEINRTFIALTQKKMSLPIHMTFDPLVFTMFSTRSSPNCLPVGCKNLLELWLVLFKMPLSQGDRFQKTPSWPRVFGKNQKDKEREKGLGSFETWHEQSLWQVEFILNVLQHFGFSSKWKNLIQQCISTVSFSILIKGKPSKSFFPWGGV